MRFFLLLINYFDNQVMRKFIVSNRTDALKTDVKLFFTITNCQIVRSRCLTCRTNYNFMCLFAYWQWKLANECDRISAVIVKIYIASGPSGIEILNLRVILSLTMSVKIIIAKRKTHIWYFVSIIIAEWNVVLIETYIHNKHYTGLFALTTINQKKQLNPFAHHIPYFFPTEL